MLCNNNILCNKVNCWKIRLQDSQLSQTECRINHRFKVRAFSKSQKPVDQETMYLHKISILQKNIKYFEKQLQTSNHKNAALVEQIIQLKHLIHVFPRWQGPLFRPQTSPADLEPAEREQIHQDRWKGHFLTGRTHQGRYRSIPQISASTKTLSRTLTLSSSNWVCSIQRSPPSRTSGPNWSNRLTSRPKIGYRKPTSNCNNTTSSFNNSTSSTNSNSRPKKPTFRI